MLECGRLAEQMRFTVALTMCDPSHYLPLAVAAEQCGWDAVAVPDAPFYPEHVTAKYPYTEDGSRFWPPTTEFVDPWVVIPAMAAVTVRLRFYTNVLKLPIRSPLLVAKTVSTAAVLSGNRVGLGVGISWIPEEARYCGTEFRTRGARTDEAIEIIRSVMEGGMVEFHGEHYDFDRLQMSPVPSERVPIYVGGLSRAAFRRAVRYGDGWISVNNTAQQILDCIEQLNTVRAELGKGTEPFEIHGMPIDVADADGYRRLEDAGMTDAIVWPWILYGGNPDLLDDKKKALERFSAEVILKAR
jgi:probable F420-dependent oxidoreductase